MTIPAPGEQPSGPADATKRPTRPGWLNWGDHPEFAVLAVLATWPRSSSCSSPSPAVRAAQIDTPVLSTDFQRMTRANLASGLRQSGTRAR